MDTALLIVAWWVVGGLPLLMLWRITKLLRTHGQPALFYAGSWCVIIGVLVWVPFCWFKRIQGMDLSVAPFLITHLALVMPGAVMKRAARKQQVVTSNKTASSKVGV